MRASDLDWIKSVPIAHRGLHDEKAGIIENSLSAVEAAIKHGYSIEVDLHPSRDVVPMVFHDSELGRLTGIQGVFHEREASQLTRMKLSGSDDTVPTLRQLLDLVDGKVGLVLELKGAKGEDDGFVEAVFQELNGYSGPVAIMSFDIWLLEDARRIGTERPLGLTAEGKDETAPVHSEVCKRLDIDFVSYNIADLPNPFVEAFRTSGKPVITWTVRSPEQADFSNQHADQITFEGFLP